MLRVSVTSLFCHAPKRIISHSKVQKFTGEGLRPAQTLPSGKGTPPPHTHPSSATPAPRTSRLRQRRRSIWCTLPEGALLPDKSDNNSVDNSGESILCCDALFPNDFGRTYLQYTGQTDTPRWDRRHHLYQYLLTLCWLATQLIIVHFRLNTSFDE